MFAMLAILKANEAAISNASNFAAHIMTSCHPHVLFIFFKLNLTSGYDVTPEQIRLQVKRPVHDPRKMLMSILDKGRLNQEIGA